AWQGNLVPPRALPGPGTDTPGLDAFVDSLAALYAGTRDHARVLERYRELAAARLRRHFGMPPETPVGVLAERLARDRRLAPRAGDARCRPGPLFTDLLLADEINRASAKTQAALLEAMQERAATVDGTRHPLGPHFAVFATQNPVEQEGTYPLPEAELDRFL